MTDLLSAVELNPAQFSAVQDLAQTYRELGQHGEALKVLHECIARLENGYPLPLLQRILYSELGTTNCEIGRCTEAINAYEQALAYSTTSWAGDDVRKKIITCRRKCSR